MGYSDRLKKAGKTFKTAKQRAKDEGGFGAELPDGRYLTELQSVELCEAQSDGHLQLAFVYEVTEGESKGETIRKYLAVEGEDNQVWLHRELLRFGIQLESLEELEKVAAILDKSKAEVKMVLKTKDSGQFAYVNKVVSEIEAGDFAADEDAGEEEESEEEESEEESEEEASEEDTEEEAGEEDEGTIELGMTVAFESKSGAEVVGEVKEILEKTEEVKVKTEEGKIFTVKAERLYIPEDAGEGEEEEAEEEESEEEEEVPAPKKTVAKKVAAKKTAAKKTVVKKTAKKK